MPDSAPHQPSRGDVVEINRRIDEIEVSLVAQEHRMWAILWNALVKSWKWPRERQGAAWAAFLWLLFFGGVAGTSVAAAWVGVIIALGANSRLDTQNERIREQNIHIEAQTHLQEAARRALLVPEITSLIERLATHKPGTDLPESVLRRIANLSIALRPYRYLVYDEPDTYKAITLEGLAAPVTALSDRPVSPERARLLLQVLDVQFSNREKLIEFVPVFDGADLRGTRLNDFDFSGLMLNRADFRNAEGFAVRFRNALLVGADFEGAELIGADFSAEKDASRTTMRINHTDLRNTNFRDSRLNNAKFDGADLEDSDFSGAILFGTTFAHARLAGVNLNGACLWQCDSDSTKREAMKAFEDLMAKLEGEQALWNYEIKNPNDHKYLGDAEDDTEYLFIVRQP